MINIPCIFQPPYLINFILIYIWCVAWIHLKYYYYYNNAKIIKPYIGGRVCWVRFQTFILWTFFITNFRVSVVQTIKTAGLIWDPVCFCKTKNNSSKIYKLIVNTAHSFTCIDDLKVYYNYHHTWFSFSAAVADYQHGEHHNKANRSG